MGAIADGFAAYMQPLIDLTDGSTEGLNKALMLGQFCFNLAIVPESERDSMLADAQAAFKMNDAELEDFRNSVVEPMIRRHEQMFPLMHRKIHAAHQPGGPSAQFLTPSPQRRETLVERQAIANADKRTGIDRYGACPCGSGKKYKFCCGVKPR